NARLPRLLRAVAEVAPRATERHEPARGELVGNREVGVAVRPPHAVTPRSLPEAPALSSPHPPQPRPRRRPRRRPRHRSSAGTRRGTRALAGCRSRRDRGPRSLQAAARATRPGELPPWACAPLAASG